SSVARAQQSGDMGALSSAEVEMRSGLGRLFAVAEDYPDLKSNENFLQLQGRITGLENALADRREFYNESVNINNVRIEQFPDSVVASMFNFVPAQMLRVPDGEKADINVGAMLRS